MRMLLSTVAVVVGCSAPAAHHDGGADAEPCTGDLDGDGVCDNVDLCPDVSDPAQLDGDGDGLGWACDSVETFSFDAMPQILPPKGQVSSTKLAVFGTQCPPGQACVDTLVAADQTSLWSATTVSTDPADAWLAASQLEQVVITADEQVLISRRDKADLNQGDTRSIDPSSRTSTMRGPLMGPFLRAGTGAPILLTFGSQPTSLVEPRNGMDLQSIASSTGIWFETLLNNGVDEWATEASPLVATYPYTFSDVATLERFTPGSNALDELSPPVASAKQVIRMRSGRGAPWCVLQGSAPSLYVPSGLGAVVTAVPFTTCALQSFTFPGTELLVGMGADTNTDGTAGMTAAFVRSGTSHEVFTDDLTGNFDVIGRDIIVIIGRPFQNETPTKVWAVWPDNSVSLLTDDLARPFVSIGGDTIHVIGVKTAGASSGPLTIRRFHEGQAVQSYDLVSSVPATIDHTVVTSAEGAAIASEGVLSWIAPSSSFVFTSHPELQYVRGGARRDHTVVFSSTGWTSGLGAAFAYDEVAGQPRITRLTNDAMYFNATLVDTVSADPSEYFVTYPLCAFGRIRIGTNGIPIVESTPCAFGSIGRVEVVAVTPTGETVVTNTNGPPSGQRLSALSETGVRSVAHGANVVPVLDRTTNPPTLVAWIASDNLEGYACTEESPLRCWAVAAGESLVDSRIEAGSPLLVSMLMYHADDTKLSFTVVRTRGPGNAQLP